MGRPEIEKTPIAGLYVITPALVGDARGTFSETYNLRDLEDAGLDMTFVQDNQSMSVKGVLRGLHFQKNHPQGKLVRVLRGGVQDVCVDLREGSATRGQWFSVVLTAENRKQVYVPRGFAHGFLTLTDTAEFFYKCSDYYDPDDECGIAWNDPDIGVVWHGVTGADKGGASAKGCAMADGTPLILSHRDEKWGGIREYLRDTRQQTPLTGE